MVELITIGRNKRTGDRSYVHSVWQKLGENKTHIRVWPVEDRFWGSIVDKREITLLKDEHDIEPASSMLSKKEITRLLTFAKIEL